MKKTYLSGRRCSSTGSGFRRTGFEGIGLAGIGLVGLGLSALTGPALGAEDGTRSVAAFEEIMVTARKQAESLSDVPLAITAFDASRLERQGILDLNDVARLTPGLSFTSVIGEFLPTPIIRGIAQTDLFSSDPNVAIFIDGVFTGAREALNFAQADLERIEVVKGPQGALYGRNAFAGAINIISKRPTNELSGKADLVYGTNGRFSVLGTISGPLIKDVLAVKVTASHSEYDGSHHNISGGPDLGGYNYDTVQGTVRFTPNEALEILGGVYYSDDKISPPATSVLIPNCEPVAGVKQTWCGTLPTLSGDDLNSHPAAYGQTRKVLRLFLDARLDVNDWQIGSLTGYNKADLDALTDLTRGGTNTYFYSTNPPGAPKTFEATMLRDEGKVSIKEFSQELRLTSPSEAAIRGSVGGYFYKFKQERPNPAAVSLTPLPADFGGFIPAPIWLGFFGPAQFNTVVNRDIENIAAFGLIEGDITTGLTARAELRYSHEKQKLDVDFSNIHEKGAFDMWTPRFSVEWKANDDLMLYGSAARGAKAGGFDVNDPSEQFNPEYNWTYELGVKGNLWDGRFLADINFFYIDWTAIQVPVLDQSKNPPEAITRNLGDATSKGIEAQFNVRATNYLTAGFGVSYIDAKYTNAINSGFAKLPSFASSDPNVPGGNVSGKRLQATSKWQLVGTLDYQRPLFADFDGFIRTNVSYRSKQYMDSTNLTVIPSNTVVNLRTGLDSDKFRLEFFVDNLFDNRRPTFAFRDVFFGNYVENQLRVFQPRISVTHPRGRELGVHAIARF